MTETPPVLLAPPLRKVRKQRDQLIVVQRVGLLEQESPAVGASLIWRASRGRFDDVVSGTERSQQAGLGLADRNHVGADYHLVGAEQFGRERLPVVHEVNRYGLAEVCWHELPSARVRQ